MKIVCNRFLKFFVSAFVVCQLYPEPVADHAEVLLFREKEADAIVAKKRELGTQLDIVGALAILENELNVGHDPIENSRLVLGMVLGNGSKDGVTTRLVASPQEKAVIERVVKKAAAHVRAPLNIDIVDVWGAPAKAMEHITALNRWGTGVAKKDPQFVYQAKRAEPYKKLDQIIEDIGRTFIAVPMIQHAIRLIPDPAGLGLAPILKQFIVCFSKLTAEEQAEIIEIYNAVGGNDQILFQIAIGCTNVQAARQYIEEHRRVAYVPPANILPSQVMPDPAIIGLIDAIPGSVVRLAGDDLRAVTTLPQRDAIRAFVEAVGRLPNTSKEVCMNALVTRKINQIIPPQVIRVEIQRLIEAISIAPVIANRIAAMLDQNPQIRACQRAIGQLPDIAKDVHYQALMTRIRGIVPTFNIARTADESDAELRERTERIVSAFKDAHEKLINAIINNRVSAITPLREVLPVAPVVVNLPIENDVAQAFVAAASDPNNRAFEARLKKFLIEHWSTYYKPKRVVTGVGNVEALLQGKFDDINRGFGSTVEKKKQKVALVESILHKVYQEHNPEVRNRIREMGIDADVPDPTTRYPALFDDAPEFAAFLQNDYSYIGSLENVVRARPPESHVYTNMAKIRELPSANWDEILNNHVFNGHPDWRRGPAEGEADYWRRIGNILIEIYNRRIKPHIYPDDLRASLIAGAQMPLIPFRAMFSDAVDASYADDGNIFAYEENAARDPARPGHERPDFDLKAERAGKAAREPAFRGQVEQSYKKVHDYTMKSLAQLFGTLHPIRAGLNWEWCGAGFDAERLELCKKVMLIFSYFDRADASWDNDFFDAATLVARFTHCTDGKKTAIEATSTRALTALGGEGGALVAEDFDIFIKKIVLNNFKGNAISALASHENAENVSIIANIKFRHQAFWNVPSAVQAQFPRYSETDYYLGTHGDTDRLLQYFYQHVYVGPHELVNTIYNYLTPEDIPVADDGDAPPEDADEARAQKIYRKAEAIEKRRNAFLGLVSTMLANLRPFTEWEEETVDYRPLLQQRYCIQIDPTPEVMVAAATLQAPEPEPHYLLTRKGIEMILFYAGYLAWNGAPDEHPLRADWVANLDWLRVSEPQAYYVLYGN